MLLITERRQIGLICGHTVYAVSKSEMIPLPNPEFRTDMAYSMNENRSLVYSECKYFKSTVLLGRNFDATYKSGVLFLLGKIVVFLL